MTFIKICGMTNIDDARAAIEMGADALGFIFADSPRKVVPEKVRDIISQLPENKKFVGVFVNHPYKKVLSIKEFCNLNAIQLHGDEMILDDNDKMLDYPESYHFPKSEASFVIKGIRVGPGHPVPSSIDPQVMLLLDTYSKTSHGGTGQTFDWQQAVDIASKRQIMLAGGLNPDNVDQAIKIVRPFGVDVSSGIELEKGRKNHDKMRAFIENVRAADKKGDGK